MAQIKHQVLILDQQLCLDSTFGKMILNSLKSCAIIANHFGAMNNYQSCSLSICVADINEENVEIRPVMSPPIFLSSSTLLEVLAAIDVLGSPKNGEEVKQTLEGNF